MPFDCGGPLKALQPPRCKCSHNDGLCVQIGLGQLQGLKSSCFCAMHAASTVPMTGPCPLPVPESVDHGQRPAGNPLVPPAPLAAPVQGRSECLVIPTRPEGSAPMLPVGFATSQPVSAPGPQTRTIRCPGAGHVRFLQPRYPTVVAVQQRAARHLPRGLGSSRGVLEHVPGGVGSNSRGSAGVVQGLAMVIGCFPCKRSHCARPSAKCTGRHFGLGDDTLRTLSRLKTVPGRPMVVRQLRCKFSNGRSRHPTLGPCGTRCLDEPWRSTLVVLRDFAPSPPIPARNWRGSCGDQPMPRCYNGLSRAPCANAVGT